MKILMVSIFSNHFFNWTKQLRNSGLDVYWLDVFDSDTKVERIDFVEQITGWRYKYSYPGRYFLKRKAPVVTRFINKWNERKLTDVLKEKIEEIQPDVVHSFVMYLSAVPIFSVMKKNPKVKWVFSSWGSDLFYYSQKEDYLAGIKKVIPKLDYMFSDCVRDYRIALKYGFTGKFLGVFPGGGGFYFDKVNSLMLPLKERNVILIKGYQGLHGKCIQVLKAMESLKNDVSNFEIVVFGAGTEVMEYCDSVEIVEWKNVTILGTILNHQVMEFMGQSIIYIGNSSSDGMPNTLLEAIIMGVFPIQSNPGGATAEIIHHGKNGFLIEDPESSQEIAGLIKLALENPLLLERAVEYNTEHIKPELERGYVKKQVLERYSVIEKELKN